MANNPIRKIIGNVGVNPTRETTPTGKEVVNFTVADPVTYGKDAPEPHWYKIAIWDKSVQDQVMAQIKVGNLVAAAGPVTEKVVNGRTYRNMSAWRIGKVNLFAPDRAQFGGQVDQAPSQIERPAPDDDDLDWD